MNDLIKNEFHKMFGSKTNKIVILYIVFISIVYGVLVIFQDQTITFYDKGIAHGYEAIEFEKSIHEENTNDIDNDSFNKIINDFQKVEQEKNITPELSFNAVYSQDLRQYEEIISLIDYTLDDDNFDQYDEISVIETPVDFISMWKNKTKSIEDVEKFSFGYSRGYQRYIKKFTDLFLFLAIGLSVCLSKMFSNDKEFKTEELIKTSANSGRKLYLAKTISGIVFSLLMYILILIPYTAIIFFVYGSAGNEVSIQFGLSPLFPYLITYGELVIKTIVVGSLASVFMAMMIMFFSKLFLSSSIAIVCSIILSFVPTVLISLLNLETTSLLRYLFPITVVDVSSILHFSWFQFLFILLIIFVILIQLISTRKDRI